MLKVYLTNLYLNHVRCKSVYSARFVKKIRRGMQQCKKNVPTYIPNYMPFNYIIRTGILKYF